MVPVPAQPPINTVTTSVAIDGTPKKRNYLPWLLAILFLMVGLGVSFLILAGKSKPTLTDSLIQPSVSPEQTTVADTSIDISSWKTYKNQKYGFSLQYPATSEIMFESQITVVLNDPTFFQNFINKYPGSQGTLGQYFEAHVTEVNNDKQQNLLKDWCPEYEDKSYSDYRPRKNLRKILIANSQASEYDFDNEIHGACLIKNGIAYMLVLRSIDSTDSPEVLRNVFYKILSTFKLLNKYQILDTSNWKAFTNNKDGYSIKYPLAYVHIFSEDVNKNEIMVDIIKSLDIDDYAEGEGLNAGGFSGDHIQIAIYPDSGDSWSEIPAIDSSTDTVIFGGQKALREISPIPLIVIGPIKHNGKIYKIQYDIPYKESDFSNFYTMLSTFKFTN